MANRNNPKQISDPKPVEFITVDPATNTVDAASMAILVGSGLGPGGSGAVASVAGKVGVVTLNSSDVGLGSVNNTADVDKPVSTAQSTAIGLKYTKPGPGIPSSDLTAAVIASLALADSAVQQNTTGSNWVESILVNYLYVDPAVPGSLEDKFDAIYASGLPTTVYLKPGATYTLIRNPTVDMATTSIVGSNSTINASGVTIGLTLDYKTGSTGGPQIRRSKVRTVSGFELIGPGRTVSGSKGIWINGSIATNSPRPSIRNVFIHDFETGIGGRDQFYVSDIHSIHIYTCVYAIWQEAGSDSGEGCYVSGSVFDLNYCNIRLDDNSSEWTFNACSFDYSRQLIVTSAPSRVTFTACHIENRGANFAGDSGNYIIGATGSDTRAPYQALDTTVNGSRFTFVPASTQTNVAITLKVGAAAAISVKTAAFGNPSVVNGTPIDLVMDTTNNCYVIQTSRSYGNLPITTNVAGTTTVTCDPIITRDVFIDIDGDGSTVAFTTGTFDINNGGGNGPYAYLRLVKARHIGTTVSFDKMYCTNIANVADLFWDGPGRVQAGFLTRANIDPSNCVRWGVGSRNNMVGNMDLVYSPVNTTTGVATPNTPITLSLLQNYQDWWIHSGRGGIPSTNRYNDSSNYIDARDGTGTTPNQPALSTTGNVTISIVQPTVGNATATAWSISGEILTVTTMTGAGLFHRDMVLAGTGVTAASRIVKQLTGTTGVAGTYLIDTVHGTVAGSGNLTGTISNAIAINKYNTETSGFLSRSRVSTCVYADPGKKITARFLAMIETTGGMAGGTVSITSQWARVVKDSTGLPVIAEQFSQLRFVTLTLASLTKDVWNEVSLPAYGALADAPTGANAMVFQISVDSNGTPGRVLFARQHASLLG